MNSGIHAGGAISPDANFIRISAVSFARSTKLETRKNSRSLWRSPPTGPSAAVVDIHLPDINGLILSQQLRERLGPDAPIIVVSGDTSMETIKSLPHVGATYFFPKPVSARQLIARLKELLGERGKDVA